jgi:AraC-like DNA-binding protein
MHKDMTPDIVVWRSVQTPQLEFRRGFSVLRPVPRHWHEDYQFCYVYEGPSELVYRGESISTPPLSLFMVHPGEVHSNRVTGHVGCSYRSLFVGTELMQKAAEDLWGNSRTLPYFPTAVTMDTEITHQYLAFHLASEARLSGLQQDDLLFSLLTSLLSRFAETGSTAVKLRADSSAIDRARQYLEDHYSENVKLEALAGIAQLSVFHFHRLFTEKFGMPPHEFQTQLRVTQAKRLLREGWSISQAAAEAGFADQSHLNRHFKRLVEPTPGRYRSGSTEYGAWVVGKR